MASGLVATVVGHKNINVLKSRNVEKALKYHKNIAMHEIKVYDKKMSFSCKNR